MAVEHVECATNDVEALHQPLNHEELREIGHVGLDSLARMDLFMGIGVNPDTGNFDAELMPRSQDDERNRIHDRFRQGEQLSVGEAIQNGRDRIVTALGEIDLRSDAVYRGISIDDLRRYAESGLVEGASDEDEYKESDDGSLNNNAGVDWYLGGTAPRYGTIVLEVPARPDYFQPAVDNGTRLAAGGFARHFKSSGSQKPVPLAMVSVLTRDAKTGEYTRKTPQQVLNESEAA